MKKKSQKQKCPVCGNLIPKDSDFCGRCSYRLNQNPSKARKKRFWQNTIFIIIVILLFYVSIRHFRGLPILP